MKSSDYTLDLDLHDGTEVIVKFDRVVDYDLATRTYFCTAEYITVYDANRVHITDLEQHDINYIEDECANYIREVNSDY